MIAMCRFEHEVADHSGIRILRFCRYLLTFEQGNTRLNVYFLPVKSAGSIKELQVKGCILQAVNFGCRNHSCHFVTIAREICVVVDCVDAGAKVYGDRGASLIHF